MSHITKKIVVYQRTVPPYRKEFFRLLAARFRNHDVRLIVATTDNWTRDIVTACPDYVWLPLRFHAPIVGRDIRDTIIIPRGLFRLLRTEKPDLAVTEDLGALPGNLAFTIHRALGGCSYFVWSLGDAILGKKRSWYRPLAFPVIETFRRSAAGFICYSDWAYASLSSKYRKSAYVAYNSTVKREDIIEGSDQSLSKYVGNAPLRLIFIGRLLPQKKVNVLLSAIAEVSERIELDVIGDGPCLSALVNQANLLELMPRVRFHGAIHQDTDKRILVDWAHLAVLPGLGGLFIQEAYARGLPVISGPADGTEQDLVRAINPEFYIEEVTVQSLAERLRFFARNRNRLRSAAEAAIEIVQEKYNLEGMVDQWVAAALSRISKVS